MNWPGTTIQRISLQTEVCDPRKHKENLFKYIDISSIDRETKTIMQASELKGNDAPSRARKEVRAGDILVSTVRPTLNAVAIVPPELNGEIASTGFSVLRPNKELIDGRYLFYFVQTSRFIDTLISKVRGAHYPAVSDTDVKEIKLPLPGLDEQRRIVEILSQAYTLRKQRNEANAKTNRIIPALYYEMFGDPVTNPYGLRKEPMRNLIKVKSGDFLPTNKMDSTGVYPVYGGNGINGYHSDFMFDEAIIILGRVGAYCGVVHYSKPKCWVTDNALYVSDKSDELLDKYLIEALRIANLNQFAGRAGQPLISANRIYPVEILVPDLRLQDDFVGKVNILEEEMEWGKNSLEKLQKIFDVLLHKAFTGDLTANWRQARMNELLQEMEHQAKMHS